eukprot:CAMPEP_0196650472 /NCGR_PEP_ID=MMETSP1085-20130531/16868_1 /TAXON_ID=41879 ORGANISM="Pycnococcus sp, Strain CCMP1998" /NCGR_SAMPLE_ID=MMETSP1085 /ASSEMBLY_ACC=CAM_ASM_000807 /LENGTH=184 /DNA_ID=CAMNT_0041980369 /DNA_START=452 /DNA_END=1005 /DNA_ORIENTATION=-
MWHCQGVPSVVPSVSEEKEVLHRSLVWAAQSRQKPDLAQRVSFSELGVVGTNEDLTNEGAVTCLGLKFGDLTRAGNPRRSHPDHLLPGVLLEIPGRDLVEMEAMTVATTSPSSSGSCGSSSSSAGAGDTSPGVAGAGAPDLRDGQDGGLPAPGGRPKADQAATRTPRSPGCCPGHPPPAASYHL